MRHRLLTAVFPAVCLCVVASTASAQFRIQIGNGHNSHGHGGIVQPHIDHHDHVIRDSHGHVRGIQHHDVIHGGTHGVVPSIGGAHIDHHDHIVRDRHGHVIGTQHHDVVHNDWSHIVPNTIHGYATGQYYVRGGQYYYSPQVSSQHVTARPVMLPFGGFTQYSDLSGRLETLVNEILLDLHYNYSHNRGFAETYREAYQLLGVAKFIHAAEHNNDREAMRSKLLGTDQLFHHIQDDVRGWTRIHHRQIGSLGIVSKMDLAEATLHHLMNDVGVSESAQAPQPGAAPAPRVEQAPPPPAAQQGYAPQQGARQGNTPQRAPAQSFSPQRSPAATAAPLGNSPPPPTVQ